MVRTELAREFRVLPESNRGGTSWASIFRSVFRLIVSEDATARRDSPATRTRFLIRFHWRTFEYMTTSLQTGSRMTLSRLSGSRTVPPHPVSTGCSRRARKWPPGHASQKVSSRTTAFRRRSHGDQRQLRVGSARSSPWRAVVRLSRDAHRRRVSSSGSF